jgi:hypothetical protein
MHIPNFLCFIHSSVSRPQPPELLCFCFSDTKV